MKPVIDTAANMTQHIDLLRLRGVRTVIRYYNHKNSKKLPEKRLELDEAKALADAGFTLAVVFQEGGGAKGKIDQLSRSNGQRDATQALRLAKELGQPQHSAIYFAVDHDYFRHSELRAIEPYFAEIQKALAEQYRVGIYASGAVAGHMQDKGYVDLVWLPGATGWAGTRDFLKTDRWALFQGDIDKSEPGAFAYDGNDVFPGRADFGQFSLVQAAQGSHWSMAFAPAPTLLRVNARSGLKLRSAPSLSAPDLKTLPNDSIVHGLKHTGDWVQVDIEGDGTADGFMYADYLETISGGFPVVPAVGATPYDIARQELALEVKEVKGPGNNPRIVLYHRYTSLKAKTDETAWCSAFVNYCVATAGQVGTNSAAARSWHNEGWGTDVTTTPRPGDIVVFSRSGPKIEPGSGHVGFWVGETSSTVSVLGGNQGDRIKIENYPKDDTLNGVRYKLLSIRRPLTSGT